MSIALEAQIIDNQTLEPQHSSELRCFLVDYNGYIETAKLIDEKIFSFQDYVHSLAGQNFSNSSEQDAFFFNSFEEDNGTFEASIKTEPAK